MTACCSEAKEVVAGGNESDYRMYARGPSFPRSDEINGVAR